MNKNLPVYNKMNEIVSSIKEYDTLILTAETGSGKSTQVPQMLFEAGYEVIVTQPRRIACLTLADRVAEEMGDNGNVVAYHTAFESNRTKDTKILFCTDGLQMAKGIKDANNTVLVLDEVHEWNLNIETLVAWIKKFRKDGHKLKVVLMSATIELEELAKFYGIAKCISIQGRTYDVEKIFDRYSSISSAIVKYSRQGKNILAFVEGKKEIDDVINELYKIEDFDAEILPLHGELSVADQNLCFYHYDRPKVIVSTNIAQTSVTIPDIDVVIDNGKEKRIEVNDGIEGLFVHNISKADCLQRAGRAGRTKNGIYVLCSLFNLEERDEFSTPEIQRLVLDKVVLKLLSVGINPLDLEFFHQPSIDSLNDSIDTLRLLGAIDGLKVTDLGKRMIKLPVSVRFARMIIEAEKYNCTEKLIKAVSIMEVGSLINYKAKKQNFFGNEEKLTYSNFSRENKSDILAEIEIYDNCINHKYSNLIEAGINKKMFFRVKEFVTKFETSTGGEIELTYEEPNKLEFIKCILSGIPDRVFKRSYNCYGTDSYEDKNEYNDYHLNQASCLYGNYAFVIGIPRTITYKDKWGMNQTMDIITMASGLTVSDIEYIAPEEIKTVYDESDISYDYPNKCFIVPYERFFLGFHLDDGYKTVHEDTPEFIIFKEKHAGLIQKENSKRVMIGRNVYTIRENYWSKNPTISIGDENDILISDIKTLKDANGKAVEFEHGMWSNFNLDIIRQKILQDKVRYAKQYILDSLPHGKTGSIKKIIEEFLDKLGKVDCSIKEYNIEDYKFIGLVLDKGSVALEVFDSEEVSIESTNDALKAMIKKHIDQNYQDKKFTVKHDGKRIETKKTEAAKQEFHEYCQEIINDTTAENFAENIDFLEEVFNECISQFQDKSN